MGGWGDCLEVPSKVESLQEMYIEHQIWHEESEAFVSGYRSGKNNKNEHNYKAAFVNN